MTPDQVQWATQQAYFLGEHSTNLDVVRVRKTGVFSELAMLALQDRIGRDHGKYSSLLHIYEDLLTAWYMAEIARPISMNAMTFGEFVRWHETTVMPTWK